ncbi:FHOD1 family protein [Megaselia abdita]
MASYRNYMPSIKSNYSSYDTSTPRLSVSSYRPSFSGGTYRSSPIKRDLLSQFSSIPSTTKSSPSTDTKSTLSVPKYGKSRDPSPAVKSRDPSPANSHLRCKSRDPSPSIKNGESTYQSPYRPATRTLSTTSSYTPRYRTTGSLSRTPTIADKSISYLSSSDFRGKSSIRTREKRVTAAESKNSSPSPEVETKTEEPESFISVSVVTRGTSPTPPNSTTVVRTRRLELAKTIEKVIQRSTKKVEYEDKEVQSDRMDDSTRYSRFSNSRIGCSVSPRYSNSSSISPEKSPRYQDSKSSSISPEKAVKSSSASLSPAKSVSQLLPPISSSSKSSSSKLPNKDFRKSALNVGPTNRSRKVKKSEKQESSSESSANSSSANSSEKVNNKKTKIKENTDESINKDIPTGVTHPRRKSSSASTSSTSSSSSDSTSSSSMSPFIPTDSSNAAPEKQPLNNSLIDTNASLSEEFTMTTSIDYNSMNTSQDVNTESELESVPACYKIRHFESGEIGWWLKDDEEEEENGVKEEDDDDATYAESIKTLNQDELEDKNEENGDNTDSDFVNVTESKDDEVNIPRWWKQDNIASIKLKVCRVESGERAWWLNDTEEDKKDSTNNLGNRSSPEGVEDQVTENLEVVQCDRRSKSPYDNVQNDNSESSVKCNPTEPQYWGHHKNIDDVLGGANRPIFSFLDNYLEEISPDQVVIHDSTAQMPFIQRIENHYRDGSMDYGNNGVSEVDDAAIQVYKNGDYGTYLDLESSLDEQSEEIEGLNANRKNSLVVRTQLSVRVHNIIEKLLSSEGSELRKSLFSLKQIFQEDKDIVHGFVAMGGLNCLVRVGNGADQNYQNYILRALGQVMLYVDGMNGVMKHGPTIQWLYSLIASKYRLVIKTSLKLLLVFVEYVESNCYLLVNAIHTVDITNNETPWANVMKLLRDYDNPDTELLIYATSLINKTLAGLHDQDSFYDESDFLEQQGMESIVQRYMSRPGTDLELLDQLQLYETVLKFEDGEINEIQSPDNSFRKTLRYRSKTDSTKERRKSRRHSTRSAPTTPHLPSPCSPMSPCSPGDEESSGSMKSNEKLFRECYKSDVTSVTPGLRKRRERVERHKSFLKEQQQANALLQQQENIIGQIVTAIPAQVKENAAFNNQFSPTRTAKSIEKKENSLNNFYSQLNLAPKYIKSDRLIEEAESEDKKLLLQLKRDHTVKDLTQKLNNLPSSPTVEEKQHVICDSDLTGLISKAKEGLAKSKSRGDISRSSSIDHEIRKPVEVKKSENELHWEELVKNMTRPLNLCDLDFTDLNSDDEKDPSAPRGLGVGIPPPPPPFAAPSVNGVLKPPPLINMPPPPTNFVPPPILPPHIANGINGTANGNTNTIKKNKKTVKLFWKEVREDLIPPTITKTIWDELPEAHVDQLKLEHLFESRAKDLITKKQQEMNKNKEIIVLDHKRSNAINIAITKLPPPRAIKAAILKMDATVVTREGIDKLLNMLPTEEEKSKIQDAQMASPELPLGSAEQFLLTLASISELAARLKLWSFKLDFENNEKEIAEPLNDLKQGVDLLRSNRTFKCILSTLLSIGIVLNGQPVKGFQIEYLAKVPEVKDTVHKHSLLHHLCHMVMETRPDTSDLYSEIGPITRASKADFNELAHSLIQLETECKASWDRLKLIAKHDCPPQLKQKLVDFLADCAERIIILQIVHRRVMNRYRKFLLWLGIPQHRIAESSPNKFCKILSEFSLEYRTTRERVQQQIEKKANHRERNKTRGKMITDVNKIRTKEDKADAELKELLGSPTPVSENCGTLTWRRRRGESQLIKSIEDFTDGDDEIIESLVKTATRSSRQAPRERKRTRNADRKSCEYFT